MAGFEMCERCRAEYEDPLDRRFHAQPNACPRLRPAAAAGRRRRRADDAAGRDPIAAAADLLALGRGPRGQGDRRATTSPAWPPTRRPWRRCERASTARHKPFALMAADLEAARELVELTAAEEALLTDRARPIVVARRRAGAAVAGAVAPRRVRDLGVMLPYSPLHHLLLADAGAPLVMTSGNVSDEPIAFGDDDARRATRRASPMRLLVHDRPIHIRTDDSVLRSLVAGACVRSPLILRRSRGYVPRSDRAAGAGAAARARLRGRAQEHVLPRPRPQRAWVGHHIGDLRNWETLSSFREGVEHFERLFAVEPEVRRPRPAPRLPLDRVTRWSARGSSWSRSSTTTRTSPPASPSTASPAPRSARSSTAAATGPTRPSGEASSWSATPGGYERAGFLFPVRLPGGDAAVAGAVADGVRLARRRRSAATIPSRRRRSPARSSRATGTRSASSRRPASTRRRRPAPGGSSTRSRRSAGSARGSATRARRRPSWSPPRRSSAADAYPIVDHRSRCQEAPLILDPRETVRRGRRRRRRGRSRGHRRRPLPRRARQGERRCLRADRDPARDRASRCSPGACSRTGCWSSAPPGCSREAGLRVLIPERLPPNDGGISYGQVAIAIAGGGSR